jgi:hypothetical protein
MDRDGLEYFPLGLQLSLPFIQFFSTSQSKQSPTFPFLFVVLLLLVGRMP